MGCGFLIEFVGFKMGGFLFVVSCGGDGDGDEDGEAISRK